MVEIYYVIYYYYWMRLAWGNLSKHKKKSSPNDPQSVVLFMWKQNAVEDDIIYVLQITVRYLLGIRLHMPENSRYASTIATLPCARVRFSFNNWTKIEQNHSSLSAQAVPFSNVRTTWTHMHMGRFVFFWFSFSLNLLRLTFVFTFAVMRYHSPVHISTNNTK